ncbi:MAG: mechanosensitive ion channel family protein [Flavisolibacter sp.]
MDIKTEKEISKEKEKTGSKKEHRSWMLSYIIIAVIAIVLYFVVRLQIFNLPLSYKSLIQHLLIATFFVFLVLIITKAIELIIVSKSESKSAGYNVIRLIRLISIVIAGLVIVTFLFQKWYTAAVSLGLFSLILGFALQTPISSLIGWFYIIIRTPYKVGDRIQVGTFTGDVVEISYLDTTLWEFGGNYLSNDVSSGRLIRFPNTMVLQSQIYNYSWEKFPYIWNEIPFHVAYESDLTVVEQLIKQVAIQELDKDTVENIKLFKSLVEQTPVDELNIKEYPYVTFRINVNTWVEVAVTYLVEPKRASVVRSRLIKSILAEFNKQKEKVLFPNSNSR